MTGHTSLYRLHNADGDLLYIGIAGNPGRRFEQHAKDKAWWGDVANITLDHYPTREEAEAAEIAAIKAEHPVHNIAHAVHGGRPPAKAAGQRQQSAGLTGLYFHTPHPDMPFPAWQRQGRVLDHLPGDHILVQWYDALHGQPNHCQTVHISETPLWRFYLTHEVWVETGDRGQRMRPASAARQVLAAKRGAA